MAGANPVESARIVAQIAKAEPKGLSLPSNQYSLRSRGYIRNGGSQEHDYLGKLLIIDIYRLSPKEILRGDSPLRFFDHGETEGLSLYQYLTKISAEFVNESDRKALSTHEDPKDPAPQPLALLKGRFPVPDRYCDAWAFLATDKEDVALTPTQARDLCRQSLDMHPFSLREFCRSSIAVYIESKSDSQLSVKAVCGHELLRAALPELGSKVEHLLSPELRGIFESLLTESERKQLSERKVVTIPFDSRCGYSYVPDITRVLTHHKKKINQLKWTRDEAKLLIEDLGISDDRRLDITVLDRFGRVVALRYEQLEKQYRQFWRGERRTLASHVKTTHVALAPSKSKLLFRQPTANETPITLDSVDFLLYRDFYTRSALLPGVSSTSIADSHLKPIITEFLHSVALPHTLISPTMFADLPISSSKKGVVFRNFGHLLYTTSRLQEYEHLRINKAWGPSQNMSSKILDELHESHYLDEREANQFKELFPNSSKQSLLYLRSLNQPIELMSPEQHLEVLKDALLYVGGRIPDTVTDLNKMRSGFMAGLASDPLLSRGTESRGITASFGDLQGYVIREFKARDSKGLVALLNTVRPAQLPESKPIPQLKPKADTLLPTIVKIPERLSKIVRAATNRNEISQLTDWNRQDPFALIHQTIGELRTTFKNPISLFRDENVLRADSLVKLADQDRTFELTYCEFLLHIREGLLNLMYYGDLVRDVKTSSKPPDIPSHIEFIDPLAKDWWRPAEMILFSDKPFSVDSLNEDDAAALCKQALAAHLFTLREFSRSTFGVVVLKDGELRATPVLGHQLLCATDTEFGSRVKHLQSPELRELFKCLHTYEQLQAHNERSVVTLPYDPKYDQLPPDSPKEFELDILEGIHKESLRLLRDARVPEDRYSEVAIVDRFGRKYADSVREVEKRLFNSQSELAQLKKLPLDRRTKSFKTTIFQYSLQIRKLEQDEQGLRLTSIDSFLARPLLEESKRQKNPTFIKRMNDVLSEVLDEVHLPNTPIFSCSFSDLPLCSSDGRVVFGGLGHLLCTIAGCDVGNLFSPPIYRALEKEVEDNSRTDDKVRTLLSLHYRTAKAGRFIHLDVDQLFRQIQSASVAEMKAVLASALYQLAGRIPGRTSSVPTDIDYLNVACVPRSLTATASEGVNLSDLLQVYREKSGFNSVTNALHSLHPDSEVKLESIKQQKPKIHPTLHHLDQEIVDELLRGHPALERFVFARKADVSENPLVLPFPIWSMTKIVKALSEPAKNVQGFGFNQSDDAQGKAKQLESYLILQDTIRAALREPISQIVDQFEILKGDSVTLTPSELQGRPICDANRYVLAESFQHLLSIYREMLEVLVDRQRSALYHLKISSIKRYASLRYLKKVGPDYQTLVECLSLDAEDRQKLSDAFRDQSATAMHCNYQVAALQNISSLSDINRPEIAKGILDEVCLHIMGARSYEPGMMRYLRGKKYRNPQGSFTFTGGNVAKIYEKLLKNDGDSNSRVALNLDPSVLSEYPSQIAELAEKRPLLRSFLYPRHQTEADDVVVLKSFSRDALMALFRSPPETHDDTVKRLKREDRLIPYKRYADQQEQILKSFLAPLIEMRVAFGTLDHTGRLPGKVLVDKDGLVIAESFGYYITVVCELAVVIQKRIATFRKLTAINFYDEHATSSRQTDLPGLLTTLSPDHNTYEWGTLFQPSPLNASRSLVYTYTLLSLNAAKDIIELSHAEISVILNEAALQVLGQRDYSSSNHRYIFSHKFKNESSNCKAYGSTLNQCYRLTLKSARSQSNVQAATFKDPQTLRRTTLYRELFEDLEVPLGTVFLALCAVGDLSETKSGLKAYRERIIKSRAEPRAPRLEDPATSETDPKTLFTDFIDLHLKRSELVNLTEVGRERFTALFWQLCFRAYGGDSTRMASELERMRTDQKRSPAEQSLAASLLEEIIPRLEKQLEQIANFVDPETIKFTPFPHQRIGVINALYQNKPNLIFGTGTGKTKTIILYAESVKAPAVLVLTKAANRTSTAEEIAEAVDSPVFTFEPKHNRLPAPEIGEILNSHRYVVASHQMPVTLLDKNKDAHEVLNTWLSSGLKAPDEVHKADNIRSDLFRGMQSLKSRYTLCSTATPVQHRLERVAAMLHLPLPRLYPEPAKLEAQFKGDRELGLALFHQHSTCFHIDEVALPFKPFVQELPAKQLDRGVPLIPRLNIHRHPVTLSVEHSLLYAKLAFDFDAFAEQNKIKKGHLRQLACLRRLLYNPTRLGASPSYSIVSAVKELAIPALQRGEKVLILGQHVALLELLAADPELQLYKAVLRTGKNSSAVRAATMRQLEEDPEVRCVIGQNQALGSGFNARGVQLLISLELPKTVSDTLQIMGRIRRILTRGMERFALPDVNVCFLDPQLDLSVVESVQDPVAKRLLSSGTIYEQWLTRRLEQIEEYKILTSQTKIRLSNTDSISSVVSYLANAKEQLQDSRHQFDLLRREDLPEYFERFRSKKKTAWREDRLAEFVANNLHLLSNPVDKATVALLPGPEALEIPVYLKLGFQPRNIFAFEADPDIRVRRLCRQRTNKFGCRFSESRIESVIPTFESPIDIHSVDSHGYLTPDLLRMFVELQTGDRSMVLKNTLCGREQSHASALIDAAGGDRQQLDVYLLQLYGSQLNLSLGQTDIVDTVRSAKMIRDVSHLYAAAIAPLLSLDTDLLTDVFTSLACGSQLVTAAEQFKYHSDSGRPYLSTFAAFEKWDQSLRSTKTAQELVRAIREVAFNHELQGGVINAEAMSSKITVSGGQGGQGDITLLKQTILLVVKHFAEKTPDNCQMSRMLEGELQELVVG